MDRFILLVDMLPSIHDTMAVVLLTIIKTSFFQLILHHHPGSAFESCHQNTSSCFLATLINDNRRLFCSTPAIPENITVNYIGNCMVPYCAFCCISLSLSRYITIFLPFHKLSIISFWFQGFLHFGHELWIQWWGSTGSYQPPEKFCYTLLLSV